MVVEPVSRTVQASGSLGASMFGIDVLNHAHIFGLLRSSIYTNKILAVIREYATNAWDAHQDAFIGQTPIKVVLPTELLPMLRIRDYGFGLSEEGVRNVYPMYGTSTKRGNNRSVGYLGIGSKSAFCYSDLFTVTSWHNGEKSVYTAVMDETGIGQMDLVHRSPCGGETGIEVAIPVNVKDIPAFHREAAYLFSFFHPVPNVNVAVTPRVCKPNGSGFIREQTQDGIPDDWIAVMGIVPYRLDFSRMVEEVKAAGLDGIVRHARGGLKFEIGEISVAASREEVEYTPRTKAAVIAKLKLLFEELVRDLNQALTAGTVWEKRLRVREFYARLGEHASVADAHVRLVEPSATLYTVEQIRTGDGNVKTARTGPRTFRIFTLERSSRRDLVVENPSVNVEPLTKILIREGFTVPKASNAQLKVWYVIPKRGTSLQDVQLELNDLLCKADLTGIPVEVQPQQLSARYSRPTDLKHVVRRFRLRPDSTSTYPFSSQWDVVDHVPSDDDVFVILAAFEADCPNFYTAIQEVRDTLRVFNQPVPPIYGVKHTARFPTKREQVAGIHFETWRDAVFGKLVASDPELCARIRQFKTCQYARNTFSYGFRADLTLAALKTILSEDHIIPRKVQEIRDAQRAHEALPSFQQGIVRRLAPYLPDTAALDFEEMFTRYPLIRPRVSNFFGIITESERATTVWKHYFQLIDRENP